MKKPPIPEQEAKRQQALEDTGLLDTGSEARFDRIVRLAQHAFSVPIVLVSLVDRDRQWFKSREGLDAEETPRDVSFCGHAILSSKPFIVENTLEDPRFADNPLVTNAPNIRFYAGVPLHTCDGYRIGTLCLIDTESRQFPLDQINLLEDFAATVQELIQSDEISHRSLTKFEAELLASRNELSSVIENMPGAIYRCLPDENWTMLYISGKIEGVSGYQSEELINNKTVSYADLIHPDDSQAVTEAVVRAMADDKEWHIEYRIRHRNGNYRWVEERGKCVIGNTHNPKILEGMIIDITRQRDVAHQLTKHHDALALLNDIAFTRHDSLNDRIESALTAAREYLRVDTAILSHIEGSTYTVRWASSKAGINLNAGQTFEVQQTWCQLVLSDAAEHGQELFIANTKASDKGKDMSHPCYREKSLGSYVGIGIEVEGRPYGTLSFSALKARANDYADSERLFVRLLARWLSDTVSQNLVNERLTKLMAQLPGVTYQFRRYSNGRVTFPFSSPQIKELYGISPEQAAIDATPAFDRIHPDDLGSVATSIEHSANSLDYWQARYRVQYKNNEYRWIEGQARPERLPDGSTLWHGYLHDVHERQQDRMALEHNEARLRGLFDFSPIGIALNDLQTGQFIDLNEALLAPTGYTREEFIALSYWDVTPREYAEEEEKALESMNTTGHYGPFEKEYIRKDGSRYPVRLQGMVSQEKDGQRVIWSLIEDITERRKLETMKEQFIATVSHELRTPLTSINGSLRLLSGGAGGALPDRAQRLISTAERNAQRLAALVNDLLDMEKLIAGKMPMKIDTQAIGPILDEALEVMTGYSEQHQVSIQACQPWPECLVRIDGQRLSQALTNLLSNAIKFSPAGEFVELSVKLEADNIEIVVRDHGPGIDPDFREQLFKRFSQADGSDQRKFPGTGLGLAITREICQQLGGHAGYRDASGGGSEFFIQLPTESIE